MTSPIDKPLVEQVSARCLETLRDRRMQARKRLLACRLMSVDLEAIRLALSAALATHPPKEDGYRVSPDSGALAAMYAIMTFQQIQATPITQLAERQLKAMKRWQPIKPI